MEWESINVAAAKMSIQKQPQTNWVSKEAIKQCCEKKLCICCEASEHFKSNCLYCPAQWLMISIIIVNITTTVPETVTCESDVMKVNDSEKE